MDIMHLKFEEQLLLSVKGQKVEIFIFETAETGNIKFGVNAPQNVSVDREEIYLKKKLRGA